ncbi:30S ribosomal protein S2 [bacterium]|nr:30S ribosomal protein S2 [bacterium]
MPQITLEELLVSGTHFGHLARVWNPKMRPYIFMKKNGVHIMDLNKTLEMLQKAAEKVSQLAEAGEKILFVGTKKQAREIIKNEAERCGMYFMTERWLGGTLTNLQTVRKSIKTLKSIEKKFADGTSEKINKKERLDLDREREKLEKVLGGIKNLNRLPGALFVVDIKKEHIAVAEAKKLGIPVFAIVDTNCDPDPIDYIIPGNDDAFKAIAIITKTIADAALEGSTIFNAKNAHLQTESYDNQSERENQNNNEKRRVRRKRITPRRDGDAKITEEAEENETDSAASE